MNSLITRKAAIGFLLLAIIVFPTAYFWSPTPTLPTEKKTGTIEKMPIITGRYEPPIMEYHAPLIQFEEKWQGPAVITFAIELFTLVCYIALKKLEPAINTAAETAMRRLREQNEQYEEDEDE